MQYQVHIFINVEFHLICQLFVWSDLRYPNVTTGTKGCRDFIGKGVGVMGKASWENKLQLVIPVCNIILSQTPLFMDVGISICKCDIFLIQITWMRKVVCTVWSLISNKKLFYIVKVVTCFVYWTDMFKYRKILKHRVTTSHKLMAIHQ